MKVIIYGLPMRIEEADDGIPTVRGLFSWLLLVLPFNGRVFSYTGSYWRALVAWLWGEEGGEE